MKKQKLIPILILLLVVAAGFAFSLSNRTGEPAMTYSELGNILKSGHSSQISKIVVVNGSDVIQVHIAGSDRDRPVVVPSELKGRLLAEADDAGVALDAREPEKAGFYFSILSSFFLPILLLVGFLFMFRSAQTRSTTGQRT